MKKIWLLVFVLGILFSPQISFARSYRIGNATATYEGLVPCGKCITTTPPLSSFPSPEIQNLKSENECTSSNYYWNSASSTCHLCPENVAYIPCQLCHLLIMADEIVDFVLFKIALPLGTLLLVIGGALLILSVENPENVARGKSILTAVAIGLSIILTAYLIVGAFLMSAGLASRTKNIYKNWWQNGAFEINCPIKL